MFHGSTEFYRLTLVSAVLLSLSAISPTNYQGVLAAEAPAAVEKNPRADIPDNHVFINYVSTLGSW